MGGGLLRAGWGFGVPPGGIQDTAYGGFFEYLIGSEVHYQECVSGIRVVSQPFCVDKLNPARLISLSNYLIDHNQVSSLQRRASVEIARSKR